MIAAALIDYLLTRMEEISRYGLQNVFQGEIFLIEIAPVETKMR